MTTLLITLGEPAGIGPDCVLRAWKHAPELFEHAVVVAPISWLRERAEQIGILPPLYEISDLTSLDRHEAAGLRCWNPLSSSLAIGPVQPGVPSAATAAAVIACIESASRACIAGQASALVTGPIEKAVLKSSGFNFPGHTEFLAWLARDGESASATHMDHVMMLASDVLRVALLTTHIAISEVPASLSTEATIDCLRIVDHDLRHRFSINQPRIALCALNPHGGEQGHFGREEIDILAPAVAAASQHGVHITGPLPADTLFSAAMRARFDAIVCCYHDQALIPLKALSFGDAVNVTLGLPFVRTSVDHGTALDRVGREDVLYSSMMAAIRMAEMMVSKAG
ncbi:4-hydroxythreonine-4-phosphate dehydrogenase PdxA [Mariprofundus erugo]|uniref:4-hydroxythreonine-4-phosphate dehydrogenase n=1 Tax=Mariprofundus erugo TaxID=2528639 RepID=A0A5R9GR37_9PROT|nr:4-hydroxythreonine-4-phosphate dehydrogenase PdxA [Mariprofundus erugo]TLS68701.1 4-hydroxythreonine-4-phosphate dehydrogenase PdxA [Mariprofundus erugo]